MRSAAVALYLSLPFLWLPLVGCNGAGASASSSATASSSASAEAAARYTSEALDYEVTFPWPPKEHEKSTETSAGKLPIHIVEASDGATAYMVQVSEYPTNMEGTKTLDDARDGGVIATGGTNVKTTSVKVSGIDGYDVSFETKEGGLMHERLFVVKKRLYTLMTVGVDHERAARFFDSFALTKP